MAIFSSTAFSKLRKSFGNLTTCRSRGQNIVKEKVTEVYNPRTPAQRKQRKRMSTLIDLCGVYSQVTGIGFPQRSKRFSPDNAFVQENQRAVVVNDEFEARVNYEQIIVSKGNRELPEVTVVLDIEKHQLVVTPAVEHFMHHAANDDQFYAAVLEQTQRKLKVFQLNERKDTEAAIITLPAKWNVVDLVVYVFILSKDRRYASMSRCIEVD